MIDNEGNQKVKLHNHHDESEESDPEEIEDKLHKWWMVLLDNLIIDRTGYWFRGEQLLINTLCIVSSYQYMYAGVFGELDSIQWYINLCEGIFLFDFVQTFFTEYVPDNCPVGTRIRSFEKIFWNYLYGQMLFDLLPLIPFPMLKMPNNE